VTTNGAEVMDQIFRPRYAAAPTRRRDRGASSIGVRSARARAGSQSRLRPLQSWPTIDTDERSDDHRLDKRLTVHFRFSGVLSFLVFRSFTAAAYQGAGMARICAGSRGAA
jgi:hypothetical protein